MGFNVLTSRIQDSPRRAHSIAAQGGINAAKNYQNDGDSIYRLFYDTVKGGDYRAREANVYRLAEGVKQHHRVVIVHAVNFASEFAGLTSVISSYMSEEVAVAAGEPRRFETVDSLQKSRGTRRDLCC